MVSLRIYRLIWLAAIFISFFWPAINADSSDLEPAHYDYKIWEVEIKGDYAVLKGHMKLTVTAPYGDKYGYINLHENQYFLLEECDIKIYDNKNEEFGRFSKKDMEKSCGFGSSYQLYQDICFYYFDHYAPQYPYSIEWEFRYKINSLFFLNGAFMQESIPVDSAEYRLTAKELFDFNYHMYGVDAEPDVDSSDGAVSYLWRLSDIPAYEPINYSPDGIPEEIQLKLVPYGVDMLGAPFREPTWKEIGKWYSLLAEDCYDYSGDYLSGQAGGDSKEIIRDIYNDITDRFRYVSVSIGRGGWKPHPSSRTYEKMYGDCKDLTTLLVSRLKANNIEAYPCLVLTRGEGKVDLDFPSFGFNHVITAVVMNDDTLWLDPTCFECPGGILPDSDRNLPVLMVTDSGGVIVCTPEDAPGRNTVSITQDIKINSDFTMTLQTEAEYLGYFARRFRGRLRSYDQDESRILIENALFGGDPDYSLEEYSVLNAENKNEPLVIKAVARYDKKLRKIKNNLYLKIETIKNLGILDDVDLSERETPLDTGIPRKYNLDITLLPDSSLAVDSIITPENVIDSSDVGFVKSTSTKDNTELNVSFEACIAKSLVEEREISKAASFLSTCDYLADRYIKIKLK